jgi:hypothetical protein
MLNLIHFLSERRIPFINKSILLLVMNLSLNSWATSCWITKQRLSIKILKKFQIWESSSLTQFIEIVLVTIIKSLHL